MKTRIFALMLALVLALCVTALAEDQVTVTVYDSDGLTVLNEIKVDKGTKLTEADLGVAKEGYQLSGVFVTPALLRAYDGRAIDADTSLFTAWKSAVEDTRAWMLAGSLTGYPANNWGHAWPQDDFLLQPVEGKFNTYYIELNLYKGDEFKIAVISQDYVWGDNLGSTMLADRTYIAGGEDAFATGANCKVLEDGLYGLTFVTDAETLELCKLYVERLGDAAAPEYIFDLAIHGSFVKDADGNGWSEADQIPLTQNGADYWWYGEFETDEEGEFGIKNRGTVAWFAADDGNIKVEPGKYIVYVGLTPNNEKEFIDLGTPAYYVVGTCGNKGWGGDAREENEAYKMTKNEDGTYTLAVTFTEADTDSWTDGKVAFKVVYGACGRVANEYWFGTETGDNIMVAPGAYIITFNPADGTVTAVAAE